MPTSENVLNERIVEYVRWQCMSMYSINRKVGYVHW